MGSVVISGQDSSGNLYPAAADGDTFILSGTAGKWCVLQSDGTNWVIMASN